MARRGSPRCPDPKKGRNLFNKVILFPIAMAAAMRLFPAFVIGQAIRIELFSAGKLRIAWYVLC